MRVADIRVKSILILFSNYNGHSVIQDRYQISPEVRAYFASKPKFFLQTKHPYVVEEMANI